MVAGLHAGDARADGLDHARALVTADQRQADVAAALGADVLVGVTEPGRLVVDQHLVILGLVQIQLGDLPILAGLVQHRGSRRHARHLRALLPSVVHRSHTHLRHDLAADQREVVEVVDVEDVQVDGLAAFVASRSSSPTRS